MEVAEPDLSMKTDQILSELSHILFSTLDELLLLLVSEPFTKCSCGQFGQCADKRRVSMLILALQKGGNCIYLQITLLQIKSTI